MDFSTLDPQDAMRAASEDLGLPGDFFDKMWKQESGRGTNMRSPAGARGHFQQMPYIQKEWEKRAGRSFDPDNFADGLTMAHMHMKENLARFKDPVKATAAYNGGTDPRKWGNKETQGYIKSIWGDEQAAATMPTEGFGGVPAAPFAVSAEKSRAQKTAEDNTSILGAIKTNFYDTRSNVAWHFVEQAQAPMRDAQFSFWDLPNRLELEGKTRNITELQFLRENATSAEGVAWAMDQINTFRQKDEYMANAGTATALTAGLATGIADPAGWVVGAGIGKGAQLLRVGHAALAARGAKGAAMGALVAENVVANVAMEAVADMTGQVRSLDDYAMAATFGAGFSALGVPGLLKDVETANLARNLDAETRRIQQEIMDRRITQMDQGKTQDNIAAEQARDIDRVVTESTVIRPEAERGDDVAVPRDLAEDMRRADAGEPPQGTEGQTAPTEPQTPSLFRGEAVGVGSDENGVTFMTTDRAVAEAYAGEGGTVREMVAPAESLDLSGLGPTPTIEALANALASKLDDAAIDRALARLPMGEGDRVDVYRMLRDPEAVAALREAGVTATTFKQVGTNGDYTTVADLSASTVAKEYTPYEKAVVHGVTTLREALTGAADSPSALGSPTTRNLIGHLLDRLPANLLDTMPVKFMDNVLGRYRQLFKEIETPGKGSKELTGREANVLAHEAVHSATARMLRAVENHEANVPELAKQSYQRLDELRKDFKAELEKRGLFSEAFENAASYSTKNIDEFVAQVMSDSDTRAVLASMPGRKYEADNKLQTFIRGILGLLGFNPKKVELDSALAEAVAHIDTLIQTQGQLGDDIIMQRSGSDLWAPHTLTAVADQKFADRMYDHARSWLTRSPVDPKKLEVLAQQVLKKGGAARNYVLSDGLKLASSKNPILNMMAGLVTEVTTGAVGRRTTAALKRDMLHQKLVGTSVVDYHTAYNDFRARNAGGHVEDWLKGEVKRRFDKEVYAEIVGRRYGAQPHTDAAVRQGADALEPMFQRSLDAQKQASTLGSGLLPPDAKGYVPQALNGDALANASAPQLEALASHLADHWQNVYGWTKEFATPFSRTYIARAKKRANGQDGIDFVATESPTGAVRDTLEEMRLNSRSLNARALAELDRVGAQPQNKKRLDVDLLKTLPDGTRVLDFYSTDIEQLARQHVNRVAGSVALADFNVLGQRGVNNILMSVDLAPPELRASPDEREAMARVFSEFLGQPVKGEVRSRFAANASGAMRLQRLGGLAFTQLSEMGNIISHLGLTSMFKGVASLPRMLSEVRALKGGKVVDNPFLSSLERMQGFEYGMEQFRMVARLDAPDELLRQYGKGNDLATRVIAGGNHLQAQLSFFRGLQAAQHRGVAELILKQALSYIHDGGSDVYLRDMGISPELARAIKGDLHRAMPRDAQGVPIGFDITLLSTTKAQTDLLAAVHRGTGQIIQRTFIGERGAWAHNDVAKLLLDLRTFSLVSMEKQWGRTRVLNSNGPLNGYGYAAGVLMGQMAFAIPIYLARAAVYSVGKPDQEEFIDRATQPARLVQAALNYSAGSGLAGDAFDMVASLGGGWSGEVQSALGTKSFGGGVGAVIPAAGSIDDAWKVLSGKSSLERSLKQLPMSNLPWIAPIINLTAED